MSHSLIKRVLEMIIFEVAAEYFEAAAEGGSVKGMVHLGAMLGLQAQIGAAAGEEGADSLPPVPLAFDA